MLTGRLSVDGVIGRPLDMPPVKQCPHTHFSEENPEKQEGCTLHPGPRSQGGAMAPGNQVWPNPKGQRVGGGRCPGLAHLCSSLAAPGPAPTPTAGTREPALPGVGRGGRSGRVLETAGRGLSSPPLPTVGVCSSQEACYSLAERPWASPFPSWARSFLFCQRDSRL